MRQFLFDSLQIALLRGKPLAHYSYRWQVPVIWLCILACLPALDASDFKAALPERMVFSLVLNWIHTIIMSLFLGWWLRLGNRWQDRDSSLFPLMVLVALPTVLAPLLMLLPDAAAGAVLVLLAIYQTAVLLSALTRATGVKLGHVIVGRLAFLPLELLLWMVAMSFAASLGWIDLDAMSKQLQAPATSTQPGAL